MTDNYPDGPEESFTTPEILSMVETLANRGKLGETVCAALIILPFWLAYLLIKGLIDAFRNRKRAREPEVQTEEPDEQ